MFGNKKSAFRIWRPGAPEEPWLIKKPKLFCIDEIAFSTPDGDIWGFSNCIKAGGMPGPTNRKYSDAELLFVPRCLIVDAQEWAKKKKQGTKVARDSFGGIVPIVSRRLKDVIEELDPDIHQFVNVKFVSPEGNPVWEKSDFYWLIIGRNFDPTEVWELPSGTIEHTLRPLGLPGELGYVRVSNPSRQAPAHNFKPEVNLWYVPSCVRDGVFYSCVPRIFCTWEFESRMHEFFRDMPGWLDPIECDFLWFSDGCLPAVDGNSSRH